MVRVIMFMNSSMLTLPSPSASTPRTILLQSSRLHFSPRLFITSHSSSALIFPSPSRSYARNAPSMSQLFIPPPEPCTSRNSLKSTNPSLSASITENASVAS
ncbi:hypothetical protein EUGRSUZ_I00934 [Eucalyptus grandis]|uniref:Uncharacterized protein n=2 Tax=Eucalyptus grandis TaxID=71139 RepID=A0ACC3JD40_EUCGR|nr:hypothetical protein EUGRSUZ_I00934 [Eucalyptus grandis]